MAKLDVVMSSSCVDQAVDGISGIPKIAADGSGFDFAPISDHFHPWISEQGHSPFVWSVLGAIAASTSEIEVGVGVSCPLVRMNSVVSAQAAATTAILMEGRFAWGIGSGEALNEHILGDRWPPADIRIDMLEEAIEVVRRLWEGDSVTHRGEYFTVEDARLFDLPDELPPLVVSAFGDDAARLAARAGDGLWTSGPTQEVIEAYSEAGGDGPIWSQLTVSWDPDPSVAVERAHRIWPNTGLTGQLAQDLRTVLHFEQAVKLVSPEQMEQEVPCGPDPEPILEQLADMEKLGIDHIYLHQIGNPLDGFIDFWAKELRTSLAN